MAAATPAPAQEVLLDVSVTTPLLLAGRRHMTYLRISMTGFEMAGSSDRAPVNVAIVLDRSGSMDGEKIGRAKQAAAMAVSMLEPRDILSIVTYSDTVSVLVPATRVADRGYIRRRIGLVYADGSTALFAGVSKGAEELRKFSDENAVKRVILLSDGLANVGPDSPAALGDLGASLRRSGISVTTIGLGLGYNEDLMVRLAEKSDGNHAFVENSRDLTRIFEYELGDILSVVAQDVEIHVDCREGVRPIRVLGRDSEIIGSSAVMSINQLYSGQKKYVILEVEVDPHKVGEDIDVADVRLQYDNLWSRARDTLNGRVRVGFTESSEQVERNIDRPAMAAAVMQIATEKSEEALRLRDEGRVQEAGGGREQANGRSDPDHRCRQRTGHSASREQAYLETVLPDQQPVERRGLTEVFEDEGHTIVAVEDGNQAIERYMSEEPDFVCLDIMVPGVNGYDVCREIRRHGGTVQVLFISAKSEEIDTVVGLELGADDYIVKPFGVKEMLARVNAIKRRYDAATAAAAGEASGPGTGGVTQEWFELGDLRVVPEELRAYRGVESIDLRPRDAALLQLFADHPGKVITRDELFDVGRGMDYLASSRSLDQYISQLRKKIEVDPKRLVIIQTVHAAGYRYPGRAGGSPRTVHADLVRPGGITSSLDRVQRPETS